MTELDPSGSSLVYSTYLGGSSMDSGMGIALDSTGNAYVTGYTYSSNFPTVNAFQSKLACTNTFYYNANAFIAKIGPGGSNLVFSTYFGGTNFDEGKGIAVDTNGYIYVTGFTGSTNFPTTNYVLQMIGNDMVDGHILNRDTNQNRINLSYDAFVSKLDPTGTNLVYSTLLGSTNNDVANAIAVDNTGAAYVTGWSVSSNFPNTFGTNIDGLRSFVATNTRSGFFATNVFLTKITNAIGTTNVGIEWSGLFGGRGVDVGNAVAMGPGGEVFVAGSASSTNFPTFNVPSLMRYTNSGKTDAFVIAFNTNATALLYSTFLGGKENDYGYGVAVDTNGDAYVVGQTLSANFLTYNANYPTLNGTNDTFLAKITLAMETPVITTQPTGQTNAVGASVTFSVFGTGTAPYYFQWQKDGTNLVDGGNISGATNNNALTISNMQLTNSGSYWLIVTNYGGAVTSSPAILLVTNAPPSILVQPASQTNGVGTKVTLTVIARGTTPLSYHWALEGTNLSNAGRISGATSNVLTISNVQLTNSGNYTVTVTNVAGSVTSSNAFLTVQAVPIIATQPNTNQSMAVGSTAVFAVTAIGTVPLKYQWWDGTNRVKNGSVNNGPTISGATTNVLSILNVQTTNSGSYTVVVTNVSGSVTSLVASLTVTNVPPKITVQPASQTNGVGTTMPLTVVATGTAPLSYQWQLEGVNLANGGHYNGATTNVLTILSMQLTNGGNYTVVITNVGGSVTSSVATLTVQASPIITQQPTNQSIAVGSNAAFAVIAIGTLPLAYQWWDGTNLIKNIMVHNGPTISGATTAALKFSNAQTTNSSLNYMVVVTNISGSVTSSVVSLTVTNIPPKITVQPKNQAALAGSNVTLVVTAIGSPPLNYQWQKIGTNLVDITGTNLVNGGNISGATTNKVVFSSAETTNSGNYLVIITNFGGSVTSTVAVVTVASSPVILVQPTNQTVAVGSTVSFVVNAIGFIPLSYQWLANGGSLGGETNQMLTLTNVQLTDSGNDYTVVITNSSGSVTSSIASLTVTNIPPAITLQPTNQTAGVGSIVTFVVLATGTAPLSFQWQLNETNLMDGGQITGAISNVLVISNAQLTNDGIYSVTVSNAAGQVTSSNAVLTVAPLSFSKITAAPGGGVFILSGVGGTNNGTYYVLTTSNLLVPLDQWTSIATNQFDSHGGFIFTNVAETNAPQEFYLLQLP